MGGDAENPHQISSSDDHRRRSRSRIHFPVGSLVEVGADEKGLRGVYLSATVIPPPPSTTISPGEESEELLYVEYRNLLANEEGSERLREYVDVSFVRLAPPSLQQEKGFDRGFEPDDVVGAFYEDGWWTGVVSRVVEGGKRVVVTFQNPPEELEFGLADLRAHWDWVNGMWVKQESVRFLMSMFGVGRIVEISLDKEYYRDAWIPARIDQDLGNGVFSVEYYIGEDVRAEVDSHRVRPSPPRLVNVKKKFVLLEKVDAFFDFAWWSGVIAKELKNGRYVVFVKQTKQDKEFDQWDLRPHMEWKDGKWLLPSFLDDGVGDQNMSSKMLKEGNVVQDRHDKRIEQVLCGSVHNVETSAASQARGDQFPWKVKIVRKRRSICAKPKVVKGKIKRRLQEENGSVESRSGKIAVPGETMQVNKVDNEFDDEQRLSKWAETEEMQHSSSVIDGSRDGVVVDDEDGGTQAGSALVDKCCIVPNEPQSLLPCVQKKIGVELPSELKSLPSVKSTSTTSVRETIESMRVFQMIPQKPHFQPLEHFKESLREGLSLGYMVAFASLVEKACRLQLNDPKSIIDEIMETLTELERYGFDVSIVQDRLTKLLGLKAKQEKLVVEINNYNDHITEHNIEKTRIEEEIREINEQIRKLQEKRSLAESAKEKEDDEIALLQAGLKEAEVSVKSVGCDFEGIVSSIL